MGWSRRCLAAGALCAALSASASAAPAAAPAPAVSRTVTLTLVDTAPGGKPAQRSTMVLTLAQPGCADATVKVDSTAPRRQSGPPPGLVWEAEACVNDREVDAPVLRVDLLRVERTDVERDEQRLRASARMKVGASALLGRIARGAGRTTELHAEIR
jgi:hypothetical protein